MKIVVEVEQIMTGVFAFDADDGEPLEAAVARAVGQVRDGDQRVEWETGSAHHVGAWLLGAACALDPASSFRWCKQHMSGFAGGSERCYRVKDLEAMVG